MNLSVVHAGITRRFDARLGGLSFTEFLILHHLEQTSDGKMRRVDLAEHIGLTASGVTRLLAPMEKIGLVKREANAHDARVSFVALAPGGKRKLKEAVEDAEDFAKTILASSTKDEMHLAMSLLMKIGGTVK
jgi:DNA-binding MarR family transcriptional regulator